MYKDCEGKELKIGQAVIAYTNFGMVRGTLVNIKPCNNRWIKYMRENIGSSRYCTQERLEDNENVYHVRVIGQEKIKKVGRRKNILAL